MSKIKSVFILILFFVFFLSFHELCHAVWVEPSSFSFINIGETKYINVYDEGDITMNITNQCNISTNNPAVAIVIEGSLGRKLVKAQGNGNTTIIVYVWGNYYYVPVTVAAPLPPKVSISARPENINPGESSILSWTSTDANTATIDQGIGSVPVNGSITVSPTEITTYTITATGTYGTDTASVTVTMPPTVVISADPETVLPGESSTLTWSSTYADSAEINQGIGSVSVNGTINVSPAQTTAYNITVTGPGGTATAAVTVVHSPTVAISANPETILGGESSTLTWSTVDADSCVIEPGVGSVALNGSITVPPIETKTYTITATGPGGTSVDNVTIIVSYTKQGIFYEYDALGRIKKIIQVPSQ